MGLVGYISTGVFAIAVIFFLAVYLLDEDGNYP